MSVSGQSSTDPLGPLRKERPEGVSRLRVEGDRRLDRLIAIVLLTALVAASGTLFGVLAVPAGHPHREAAEHHEAEVAHEAQTLGAGDVAAALLVSVAGVAIVPVALRSARRRNELERPGARPDREVSEALRLGVALASAGAATIHFAVIAQHLEEYWLFGSFFIAVAIAQLAWAMLVLFRPSPAVYLAGMVGNAAVAATWAVSRTTGLPLGSEPGVPESVGTADSVATAFEVLIVAGTLLLLLRMTSRKRPLARFTAATAVATLAAIGLTALSLLSLAGAPDRTSEASYEITVTVGPPAFGQPR
jgi:hypothetical protein